MSSDIGAGAAEGSASSAFRSTQGQGRQDLSFDKFISSAKRTGVDGAPVPTLGGIPLLKKLGAGGMGCVYYGVHPRLKTEVAVKVLTSDDSGRNSERVQRFFREAQVSAHVRSAHLTSVIDVNEENGLVYLVMEYVNGPPAGAWLRELRDKGRTLAETEALEICIGAAAGLAAAHAAGIVHRDVKPDNILLPNGKNGLPNYSTAKLTDLGLAHWEQGDAALTRPGMVFGTPGFLAPEQSVDAGKAGKPADVFGLGATLYYLLAGRAPFSGDNLLEIVLATRRKAHEPIGALRPGVSAQTAALIDICLAKEPHERIADGEALVQQLKLCRDALSAASPTLEAPLPLRRPAAVKSASARPEHSTFVGGTPMTGASIGSRVLNATTKYAPTAGRFSLSHLFSCARPNKAPKTPAPKRSSLIMLLPLVILLSIAGVLLARSYAHNSAAATPANAHPPDAAVPAPAAMPALTASAGTIEAPGESAELALDLDLYLDLDLDLGGGVKLELVTVPAGVLDVSSSRKIPFPRFFMGKFPVTRAQFRRFVTETAYITEAEYSGDGKQLVRQKWQDVPGANWKNPGFLQDDDHPVVMVTLADAEAFAKWAAKRTGRNVNVPIEVEWEYAAHGSDPRAFPWGDIWDGKRANHADVALKNRGNAPAGADCSADNDGFVYTSPIGKLPNASWCGAYDMSGNVWQWCLHPYGATKENPQRGWVHGGAWDAPPDQCRATYRTKLDPSLRSGTTGFRIDVRSDDKDRP